MKIAIESNDGVTLKSPFSQTRGYIICDVENADVDKSEYVEIYTTRSKTRPKTGSAFRLSDCCAIITRGMNNENQHLLKEKGIEVFITFNTMAKDALRSYMKERMISEAVSH